MSVSASFQASDGKVFASASAAECHDARLEVRRLLEEDGCINPTWTAEWLAERAPELMQLVAVLSAGRVVGRKRTRQWPPAPRGYR